MDAHKCQREVYKVWASFERKVVGYRTRQDVLVKKKHPCPYWYPNLSRPPP